VEQPLVLVLAQQLVLVPVPLAPGSALVLELELGLEQGSSRRSAERRCMQPAGFGL